MDKERIRKIKKSVYKAYSREKMMKACIGMHMVTFSHPHLQIMPHVAGGQRDSA